jgi:hypothetical protein
MVDTDCFTEIRAAFSFGIGEEASWDYDIAQRSIPVYQYDAQSGISAGLSNRGGEIGFAGGRAGGGSTKLLNSPLLSGCACGESGTCPRSGLRAGASSAVLVNVSALADSSNPVWLKPQPASGARRRLQELRSRPGHAVLVTYRY